MTGDSGSAEAVDLAVLLEENRDRLVRMVRLRMDRRLQGRIDASDVIQEASMEAAERFAERDTALPPFLWLRLITAQRLARLHRRHLGTKARNAARDVSLFVGTPGATSAAIVAQLAGRKSSPSHRVVRSELIQRLKEAVESLGDTDREILALRHNEQLTNGEVAAVMQLDKSAASKRYLRALRRLRSLLADLPGGLDAMDFF